MQVWDDLKVAQGAMKRISEISAEEEEDYEKGESLLSIDEDIHLENLSFSYEEKKVLDQVSFDIKKGGHTAIVGLSGAGKTTILNLLERFYKPDEGSIRMGEKEIDDFSLKSWRDQIGYVTQDAWIMEGSVRENLTYALEEELSDEALMEKLEELGLASLIEELSEGLDTQAGEEGSMLSGGQRQRICVARTLLKEPQFLLLDEVTANLDALTEQSITSALKKKKGQQTLLSIAHKLNTIVDADQIIVMENGKVNSMGSHASLMAEKGLYYDMYQKQMGEGGEMA